MQKKICKQGHEFYKSSDCLSCPVCNDEEKPSGGFLSRLYSPARNALNRLEVDTLEKLAEYTEKEIINLHGMGKTSMPILKEALKEKGLTFKNENQNIAKEEVSAGTIHELPDDLKNVLLSNPDVLAKWNNLTPLARNEWICWVTIPKKQETRDEHLVRLCEDIRRGHKRPCCWPGCPHRRESAQKWFKNSKAKK